MSLITWECLRCVQELTTILGPQNPTQGSCVDTNKFRKYVILRVYRPAPPRTTSAFCPVTGPRTCNL